MLWTESALHCDKTPGMAHYIVTKRVSIQNLHVLLPITYCLKSFPFRFLLKYTMLSRDPSVLINTIQCSKFECLTSRPWETPTKHRNTHQSDQPPGLSSRMRQTLYTCFQNYRNDELLHFKTHACAVYSLTFSRCRWQCTFISLEHQSALAPVILGANILELGQTSSFHWEFLWQALRMLVMAYR